MRRGMLAPWAAVVLLHAFATGADAAPLFRKTLRINPGQVTGGPLTDFPLLFNSTDPALRTTANGGRVTNANGWDIIFATSPTCADSTSCGGSKLDHEIESYNATTGQLTAWVRVPSISDGTVLYVHYGDSAVVATTENKTGVWTSGYKGVWHLRETPAGTAGEFKDSTVNANNGTGEVGPASFPTQTAGQINGSLAFDGTLDRDVNVPNSASLQLATNMTVSAWARTTSIDAQARLIVAKWLTSGSMRNYWLGKLDASTVNFGIDGGTTVAAPLPVVNDGQWHHIVGVADASAPAQMRIYVDGSLRATGAWDGTSVTGTSELRIGRSPDITLQDWSGGIDEVRVQSVARSHAWIATEHRNQSSPSSFYTLEGMRVVSGSYVGNGLGSRAIGVGLRPDVVLIAHGERGFAGDERQAVIRTATMAGNQSRSIAFNATTPLADRIVSLDAAGFSVGHPSPEDPAARQTCVNHAGVTYYWVAFQAADGELKLGTYPGTGADNRNVTGVGFQPDYVLVMSGSGGAAVWQRSSAMAGDLSFAIEGLSGTNRIQSLLADGFQVGSDTDVNQNGITFHYVAWKATPGKMNVGSYTGNNGDPRSFNGIGFRPEWVLMRRGQIDDSVMKPASTGSSSDWSLPFRCYSNCGAANSIQALEPDGFQVGNATDVNLTGETYYWAAFGPHVETYLRSIGAAANYNSFTVSATHGSTVVTGAGTAWKTANRGRGDRLRIGTVDYVVGGVDTETQLHLTTPYLGTTGSGLTYLIARQFATLQAWENCISFGAVCGFFPVASASLVADGRREIGIAYDDATPSFTLASSVTIQGSTTDASHDILLTADPGNRHNGVAGAGVVVDANLGGNEFDIRDPNVTVEWLEFIRARGDNIAAIQVWGTNGDIASNVLLQNLLIHDFGDKVAGGLNTAGIDLAGDNTIGGKSMTVRNTMIWDGDQYGIEGDGAPDTALIENVSIDGLKERCIYASQSPFVVRNTLATGSPSGDFAFSSGSLSGSNNTSSDATATSYFTNPQTALASALFVTPNADLHLKAGANVAVDSGLDLSASFKQDVDGQSRVGLVWDRGADERGATTAVRLQSLQATSGDASITIEWRTGSELDNLGFHLYRGPSSDGPWSRLTQSLIPGLGSSAVGQAYSYRDAGLTNGVRYYYRLEDVDASSKTTSHGPVSAVPSAAVVAGSGAENGADPPPGRSPAGSTCPDWVLSAAGSSAGASTAPLACTRHGDPEAVSLQVLTRDSRSALLELRTGGFYALHEPAGSVRLFVPGFELPVEAEALALPFRRAVVPAVVGRRAVLGGVRLLEQQAFPALVPSALASPEMQSSGDGTLRPLRRTLAPARRAHAGLAVAGLEPSVFQGESKSAVVSIHPLRYDARRRQLLLAKRVLVRLLFAGRETGESGRGSLGRREPKQEKPASANALLARLYTRVRGLHAASFESLFPGRSRGVSASGLRLERQGEAHAFHLEPSGGTFGPGGVLYFYAETESASTDFSGEQAYELVQGGDGVGMPLQRVAPTGAAVSSLRGSASFEVERFYQPGLLEAPDPWLWEALSSGATRVLSFSLPGVEPLTPQPALAELYLQGASESGSGADHHVSVSVNGVAVGEARFFGKQPYRMSLSLPAGLLQEGANELGLSSLADTGVASLVFLDRLELSYPRTGAFVNGGFEASFGEGGTAAIDGLSGPVALLDVTARPARWLTGYATSGGALRFSAEANRVYAAVTESALLRPRVALATPSTLRATTNRADYLLIAPRAFLAAAEPLVSRRQDQGLEARAVSFEEIADEFGHGQPSAEAIRSFLAYAYHSWARPSPRYVVLLGDATYDPRNFMGVSQPSPLPALWTKTSYLWTVSDPLLAAVNGEDALPDLAIGRLPATTLEEAQALVDKLVAWEDSGQGLSARAALVADDPDLAGDFEANVRDIASSFLGGRSELVLLRERGAGTRGAIQAALDGGLSYLSYVGHGGAAVWASENVWNTWDAGSLQAQSRQPLLLTLNCLNGYFVAPAYDSLAESLVKAEGRGAIAAFSPSGLSLDGPAHQYHRALMAQLTSGRHARLGDALLASQQAYAQSGLMPELLSVYQLLGDPAMRLAESPR